MRMNQARPIIAFAIRAVCGGVLLALPTASAFAQERRDQRAHHEFREHDVRRFDRHDIGVWRDGLWRHEMFNGLLGWWWVSGGVWYHYEAPVYPYPLVVSGMAFAPPVVVMPGAPPMVVQQVAPPPPPQPPQQQQVWYYCDNPAGYYPYVATCSMPFRPVAARPQ